MDGNKISDDVTVMGQVNAEELQQAKAEGFRSVLNLRAPEEEGILPNEKETAEDAGLFYRNIPVRKEEITDELTTQILAEIDTLPKPALIHCSKGMRAGAMAFMHMATRHGMTANQAMEKAQSQGFDCNSEPQLKQFFEHYVDARSGKGGQ